MDKKKIEEYAVTTLIDCINSTDLLSPYFSLNDKTPIWDGYIIAYSDKNKTNKNLIGQVSVQIKGTTKKMFSSNKSGFSVSMEDLKKYKDDGGVIYFVVYMDGENPVNSRKIYYATLLPIKIKSLIKGKEEQKTISVKLREFSTDKRKIETLTYFEFLGT